MELGILLLELLDDVEVVFEGMFELGVGCFVHF
jgi:hypothetical protein